MFSTLSYITVNIWLREVLVFDSNKLLYDTVFKTSIKFFGGVWSSSAFFVILYGCQFAVVGVLNTRFQNGWKSAIIVSIKRYAFCLAKALIRSTIFYLDDTVQKSVRKVLRNPVSRARNWLTVDGKLASWHQCVILDSNLLLILNPKFHFDL